MFGASGVVTGHFIKMHKSQTFHIIELFTILVELMDCFAFAVVFVTTTKPKLLNPVKVFTPV